MQKPSQLQLAALVCNTCSGCHTDQRPLHSSLSLKSRGQMTHEKSKTGSSYWSTIFLNLSFCLRLSRLGSDLILANCSNPARREASRASRPASTYDTISAISNACHPCWLPKSTACFHTRSLQLAALLLPTRWPHSEWVHALIHTILVKSARCSGSTDGAETNSVLIMRQAPTWFMAE